MASKKGFQTYSNDKQDKSGDIGSIRDGTDCSEGSSNTSFDKKMKESSKTDPVNVKNVKKSDATHLHQGISKTLNSSSPHTLAELSVSKKESSKSRNSIPKKSTSYIRVKKKIVLSKKTVSSSNHKADTHTQEVRSKTPFSKSHLKSNKQCVTKCISLTDIRNKEKDESISPFPPIDGIFSLTPSRSEDFEKRIQSNGQMDYYDYMKEFDLIRNNSLFNQWENSLWPSEKGALITKSKLSKSKPFQLKRKTYSCGILSINDPELPSTGSDKSGVKENLDEALKCDTDESDICYLSENFDLYDCDYNSGSESFGNKNVQKTSSSDWNVKNPIRIKYIDENTAQNKEVLIYSSDFLENMYKEKGKSESNIELFENILAQSTIYEGNKVRVIPDIEEFFRNLKRNNRLKKSTTKTQISKHDAQETSEKKATQSQRKIHSTPWRENLFHADVIKKRKDTLLQVDSSVKIRNQKFCQKRNMNETNNSDGKSSETKKCFSQRDMLIPRNESKELKDIKLISDDKSEIGGCSKSRTALKRINTEEIIASNFRHYFQFYAKLGGRLKSGVVISKMNSHFWLKKSGIIFDDQSFTMADDCFTAVARRKLVLNISDYMQYLSAIAKRQRLFFVDVVKRLMTIDLQVGIKLPSDLESNQSISTSKSPKPTLQGKINSNGVKSSQKKA